MKQLAARWRGAGGRCPRVHHTHQEKTMGYPTLFTTPGVRQFAEEVDAERQRQLAKFGDQHHPDGTGYEGSERHADFWRKRCEDAFADEEGTWSHVLLEEVFEAMAEADPARLRAELVQVAAVCAAWIADLDSRATEGTRRMADETATTETQAHATVRREVADDLRALFGNVVLKGQDGDWANVADYIATGARIPACGSFYPHHTDTRCSLAKGHRGSHIAPWGTRTMAWPYGPSETQPAAGARQDGADRG
ncbi:hypothetical protein [Streptomyces rochei]|uniref:hypothetical protein n=1 Tax=Streptomyces rochei TaxID=1928 RepID=UPI0019425498|nr:hypothetical protein [Streptomyces rochei]